MGYGKVLNQYKRSNIETAGRLDLIIMCYEKAIQLLIQARDHIRKNEIADRALKVEKALVIISELQGCLDMKKGGRIARNLDSLYAYMIKRLLVCDIRKDFTVYDEVARILSELLDAWQAIRSEETPNDDLYSKVDDSETYRHRQTAF